MVQAGAPTPPHPVSGSGWWTRWALTTSTRSSTRVVRTLVGGDHASLLSSRHRRAARAPVGRASEPRSTALAGSVCGSGQRNLPSTTVGAGGAVDDEPSPHPVSTRSVATARAGHRTMRAAWGRAERPTSVETESLCLGPAQGPESPTPPRASPPLGGWGHRSGRAYGNLPAPACS